MSGGMDRDCGNCVYITRRTSCPTCKDLNEHRFPEELEKGFTMAEYKSSKITLDPAQELADAHWSYLEGLLNTTLGNSGYEATTDEFVAAQEYMYKTAFIHGYKHALEDVAESKK